VISRRRIETRFFDLDRSAPLERSSLLKNIKDLRKGAERKWFTVVQTCHACLSIAISFRSMRRKSRSVASVLAYKPLGHDYLKNTRFYFKWLASCVFRQFLHALMPRFLSNVYEDRERDAASGGKGGFFISRRIFSGRFLREREITDAGITETFRNTSIVAKVERRFHDSYLFPTESPRR